MTILNALSNEATKKQQLSKIMNIEIEDIERNPLNTAPMNYLDELEELIKINGIIEPIVVYKVANHQYRLLSGERRFTVAKKLNYETLPALIVDVPGDSIEEEMLIKLHNVQRPDDEETLREKIIGFKEICDRKRERGDADLNGVRTTEWISNQLGGLSARTIQEYLTGKYSQQHIDNLLSELDETPKEPKPKKVKTLKSICKGMEKLRRDLEEYELLQNEYSRKELLDYEYESSELFAFLARNGSDITKAKKKLDEEKSRIELLREKEEQLSFEQE
ncbi:ParB/RepB/Spo0J family partition protein [Erysipelothrix rhusiopathiae]|nr:ParB/RepB/Spo0J family partition protein [Erysipelothrix rhusiopathiae]MDE8269075.1 ParB/RepB/Spo0J family partition protein [Erysipelothrix rhusiopathiae]MDE8270656.1 ParB/RepB/Spo0J family partition protein [Erysipelothrix rhusiopathiae]MDE8279081.1 ParB/RepB/Spo0J family partition protein [Erysipelothrix rhusiopathiae]MDE8319433.1 ParB/RepB/Spo0J family partition protein [Erysipelothrix rhusiopathiae]